MKIKGVFRDVTMIRKGSGILLRMIVAGLLALPALVCGTQAVAAETSLIDTAMPSTIPQEILDDWKAQGVTDAIKGHQQRVARCKPFTRQLKKLLCGSHYNEGGPNIGFLEDLNSDGIGNVGGKFAGIASASKGAYYKSGASLLVLNFDNFYPSPTALLADTQGVIRDPCVSFDGKKDRLRLVQGQQRVSYIRNGRRPPHVDPAIDRRSARPQGFGYRALLSAQRRYRVCFVTVFQPGVGAFPDHEQFVHHEQGRQVFAPDQL